MDPLESDKKHSILTKLTKQFLGLSEIQVEFPRILIFDKNDPEIKRVELQFSISEKSLIENPLLLANEKVFESSDFKPNLCHELGHLN